MWIDTVRLARDFGTVEQLFPDGISNIRDLPHPLFEAILHALLVLSWREHLEEKEQPPRRIWLDPGRLKSHFDLVKRHRDQEYGRDDGWDRSIEDPVENDAAKSLING